MLSNFSTFALVDPTQPNLWVNPTDGHSGAAIDRTDRQTDTGPFHGSITECDFITRMLFKDVYWSFLLFSLLFYVFTFLFYKYVFIRRNFITFAKSYS